MKGIVVEIKNHFVAVLSDDGTVVKIMNKHYQIGQEVPIPMKLNTQVKKKLALTAAVACAIAAFGVSAYAYYTPYTYVSLDVNPSIEYSINRFDRVLSAKGVNDDGTQIMENIPLKNLKHKSIENAISLTIDELSDAGYLDNGVLDNAIIIATSSESDDKAEELAKDLEDVANETIAEGEQEANVITEAVGAKRVAQARELGVTPGKLNLVEKMIAASSDSEETIDKTEWLQKSVKEIMAKTKEYKEQLRDDKKSLDTEAEDQEKEQDQMKEQNKEQNKEAEQISGNDTKNQEKNKNTENNGKSDQTEKKEKPVETPSKGNNSQKTDPQPPATPDANVDPGANAPNDNSQKGKK